MKNDFKSNVSTRFLYAGPCFISPLSRDIEPQRFEKIKAIEAKLKFFISGAPRRVDNLNLSLRK